MNKQIIEDTEAAQKAMLMAQKEKALKEQEKQMHELLKVKEQIAVEESADLKTEVEFLKKQHSDPHQKQILTNLFQKEHATEISIA